MASCSRRRISTTDIFRPLDPRLASWFLDSAVILRIEVHLSPIAGSVTTRHEWGRLEELARTYSPSAKTTADVLIAGRS